MDPEDVREWYGDMLRRVSQRGFDSVPTFFKAREGASFNELADELGRKFAPIQFEKALRDEVRTQADFDYFVRTMFVRQLRRTCPRGWRMHKDFDITLAIASWGSALGDGYSDAIHALGKKFRTMTTMPPGWLPSGVDDPVITALFAAHCFPYPASKKRPKVSCEGNGMKDYTAIMKRLTAYHFPDQRPNGGLAAVKQFEAAVEIDLPDDYRDFVAIWGLAVFKDNVSFPIQGDPPFGDEGLLDRFFGVSPGDENNDLAAMFELYRDRIPDDLMPVAEDPGSNIICLSFVGPRRGRVMFFDKESEGAPEALWVIAESWDEFMNALRRWEEPVNKLVVQWERGQRISYDTEGGIEVEVDGDESRRRLAQRIVDELPDRCRQATDLLLSFMKDTGRFEVNFIAVFAEQSVDAGDFSLRLSFTADEDPHEYGDTYFDVYFRYHESEKPKEFWPFKFTIGFH